MTFSTAPRSKHPVLSIQTQLQDIQTLRAEIKAATTQQQKFKNRQTRYSLEPTIEEESGNEDAVARTVPKNHARHFTPDTGRIPQTTKKGLRMSVRSISGTVKGELSTATRFLKDSSRRQLQRLSQRSSSHATSISDGETRSEMSECDVTTSDPSEPVELSSDPLYQLDDNSRSSAQFEEFPSAYSLFPSIEDDFQQHRSSSPLQKLDSLSSKSYSCDNCRQPICGGDLYDFCASCSPSDRVLCIVCARQRKCWRHQPQSMNLEKLSSARSSPAPPYSRPDEVEPARVRDPLSEEQLRSDTPCSRRTGKAWNGLPRESQSQANITNDFNVEGNSGATSSQTQSLVEIISQLVSLQLSQTKQYRGSPESRDLAFREQLAALREERAVFKEQEMLVRERERLSQERDATVIRNLQTLLTVQELARGGYTMSQVPHSEKTDMRAQPSQAYPAKSEHMPTDELGFTHIGADEVSASAPEKPFRSQVVLGDRYVRSHQGGKRKQSQTDSSDMRTTIPPGSSTRQREKGMLGSNQRLPSDQEDENEDGEATPPKKQKHNPVEHELPQRIFACPYCKHDPGRYSPRNLSEKHYRGCSGHFLHDIPRLKQHLRRVHWRPDHHCPRCFEIFDGPGSLAQHSQQTVACSLRECPFPEKMDKAQQQQVHVKRPRVSAETLWYDIYKTLFPGATLPDSPYADNDNITPPSSAVPTSPVPEEVTERMMKLFNTRLDERADQVGYDWISHSGNRQFLNTAMTDSLVEIFSALSLALVSTSDASGSAPTSTMPSPVTPPPSTRPAPGSLTVNQEWPASPEPPKHNAAAASSLNHATPILKDPKRILHPALRDPLRAMTSLHASSVSNDVTSVHAQHKLSRTPDLSKPAVRASVVEDAVADGIWNCHNFPSAITIDEGWDDESGSFCKGDDQEAMETARQSLSHSSQPVPDEPLQAPRPVKPRKRPHNFVPVRLETLEDNASTGIGNFYQSQNKSVASLVDSGYGSGNSDHPAGRVQHATREYDNLQDISPVGHVTFDEELELLLNNNGSVNPWRIEDS